MSGSKINFALIIITFSVLPLSCFDNSFPRETAWFTFLLFTLLVLLASWRSINELSTTKSDINILLDYLKTSPHGSVRGQASLGAFEDIAFVDPKTNVLRFYPPIFEIDSRYLLQKLPAFNQVMLQHSPAILTALGILFTFIGLIQGIVEIDLEGSSTGLLESMSHLVSGVGLAFYSSVAGLLLSFIMLVITRHEIQAADKITKEVANLAYRIDTERELIEQVSPPNMLKILAEHTRLSHSELKKLNDYSKNQNQILSSLATDLTEMLTQALRPKQTEVCARAANLQADGGMSVSMGYRK